jgi:hypothetical protein
MLKRAIFGFSAPGDLCHCAEKRRPFEDQGKQDAGATIAFFVVFGISARSEWRAFVEERN